MRYTNSQDKPRQIFFFPWKSQQPGVLRTRFLSNARCPVLLCRSSVGCVETVLHVRYGLHDPAQVCRVGAVLECLRFTRFCWAGKHIGKFMKSTNSPTQGQPNPKKTWVKSGIWATFPHSFRGLALFLYRKQTARNLTQPNSPQTPYYLAVALAHMFCPGAICSMCEYPKSHNSKKL